MDIHDPEAFEILELAEQHRERTRHALANPNVERRKKFNAANRFNRCERKVAYTFEGAKRSAKHIGRRHDRAAQAYHCKLCGYWHVGNVSIREESLK